MTIIYRLELRFRAEQLDAITKAVESVPHWGYKFVKDEAKGSITIKHKTPSAPVEPSPSPASPLQHHKTEKRELPGGAVVDVVTSKRGPGRPLDEPYLVETIKGIFKQSDPMVMQRATARIVQETGVLKATVTREIKKMIRRGELVRNRVGQYHLPLDAKRGNRPRTSQLARAKARKLATKASPRKIPKPVKPKLPPRKKPR